MPFYVLCNRGKQILSTGDLDFDLYCLTVAYGLSVILVHTLHTITDYVSVTRLFLSLIV